jgi:hypothetical protein
MPRREEYDLCASLGLTVAMTARALGASKDTVGYAARKHGLVFSTGHRIPQSEAHRAAISAGVKLAAASGRVNRHAARVRKLSPKERDDYRTLMVHADCRSAEAYRRIGRADLIQNPEHTAVTSRPCAGRAAHPPRAGATSPGGRGQSPAGGFHGC